MVVVIGGVIVNELKILSGKKAIELFFSKLTKHLQNHDKILSKNLYFLLDFYRLNKVALGVLQHPIKFQMKISRGIKAIELFLFKIDKIYAKS